MKVKHLILRLQECDPEAMVVVDGYEGGVTDLDNIQDSITVAINVNGESYYGEHEVVYDYNEAQLGEFKKLKAVYLPR